jgi:O-succinylbenzoic acid--CoA ligase
MDKQLKEVPLNYCPVAWQAQRNPHLIAIQTDNQSISFSELHKHISCLSLQLIKLSMKKSDRLVAIGPNSLSLVLLQLTCVRNSFIFCPVNPNFSQAETQQRLVLLDSPFVWQQGINKSLSLNFESTSQSSPQSTTQQRTCQQNTFTQPIEIDLFKIDPVNTISIIFTSGSSGDPKAVMHNFSNHYYSALGSQAVIPLKTNDKNLLSLPIFHISGYATVMRTLLAGTTLQLFNSKVSTDQLLQAQTTHLSLVSSQLIRLLDEPNFRSHSLAIKHLLLGGSAFPAIILQRTQARGFTYHLSYGSTEMASQIATSTNSESLKILPYRKVEIVNKEILLAGRTLFVGYFKRDLMRKNKYFSSSDLGEVSDDVLKIIGRKDRQFISGGENIQPEEIEKMLLSFPGLSQVYVLPINDSIYGQRPIAFIKWNNNNQTAQLKSFIKDKLIAFKRPLHYLTFPAQQGIKLDPKQLADLALKLLPIN